MGKLMGRFVLAAAVLGTVAAMAGRARADLSLEFVAAPGVDLANITVGQTFDVYLLAVGSTPGEHITGESGGVLFTGSNLMITQDLGPDPRADLTTSPILFVETITALAAGPASLMEDFSGGTISTDVATYSPVSEELDFTVSPALATPEPSTLAMLASAVPLGIGWWLRRRKRPA